MRSALCSALLCGLAIRAAAQGQPVTFEEPQAVVVTGFAVGRADYDRAARSNTLTAGKIAVSLFKPVGDAYVFGQLTTALERGEAETAIDNLIVSYTPRAATRWTFALGRFDAPIGFERDDEPLNFVPTNAFNFEFARPTKLTGAIVRFTASPRLEFAGLVANGWNVTVDNNRGKTGLVRVQWRPRERLTVALTGVYGPERDSTEGNQRSLLSGDVTFQAGRLILGTELNFGKEQQAGGNPTWGGGAATAFLRLTRSLGVAARYDHLSDSNGVLTGTGQVLRSFTIGPMLFFRSAQQGIFTNIEHTSFHLPQLALRAALRLDYSTQPFFTNAEGGLQTTDTRGVLEVVYIF